MDDKSAARRDRYERTLRMLGAVAEPYIILWGPGPQHSQGYQKRQRVREAIETEFPHGQVVFPEEEKVSWEYLGPDVQANELFQATSLDIVIALDISVGVGEEIARFSAYPRIATKLFVVAPEDQKSGYQKLIREKILVRFVTSEELVLCDKTTQLCLAHVRTWCLEKFNQAA